MKKIPVDKIATLICCAGITLTLAAICNPTPSLAFFGSCKAECSSGEDQECEADHCAAMDHVGCCDAGEFKPCGEYSGPEILCGDPDT